MYHSFGQCTAAMIQKKTACCFLRCPSAYAAETAATDFLGCKKSMPVTGGRSIWQDIHYTDVELHNVKGRISYITSHARQENLYATYRTADNEFWSNLARKASRI